MMSEGCVMVEFGDGLDRDVMVETLRSVMSIYTPL